MTAVTKVEGIEQVVDGRTVQRDIGIAGRSYRVGVVIAAAGRSAPQGSNCAQ